MTYQNHKHYKLNKKMEQFKDLIQLVGTGTTIKSMDIFNPNEHILNDEFAKAKNLELLNKYTITNFTIVRYLKDFLFDPNDLSNPISVFVVKLGKHDQVLDTNQELRVHETHITNYTL